MTEALQLEDLALRVAPDVKRSAGWRFLQWRKAMGPRLCRLAAPLRLMTLGQHIGHRLNRYRLRVSGR